MDRQGSVRNPPPDATRRVSLSTLPDNLRVTPRCLAPLVRGAWRRCLTLTIRGGGGR
jgi:hypothetical protein